jgi:hypothetical protein
LAPQQVCEPAFKPVGKPTGVVVAYGYRYGEPCLPEIPAIKSSLCVKWDGRKNDEDVRNPMMASLGPHLLGACPPHPDTGDATTLLAGVMKRIGTEPPLPDKEILLEFEKFVYRKIREWFPRLSKNTDVSFGTWIEGTQYTRARKEELRRVWEGLQEKANYNDMKHELAKCFGKMECYPEFKHSRGIFSRTDEYKVMVGPYFKAIESVVYQHPAFVKHVPVKDRPDHIMKVLRPVPGETVDANDFSSFEALFRKRLMLICEMQLYTYMVEELPKKQFFLDRLGAMVDRNELVFKWFTVFLKATRLSGGMETSLGNGVSNLLFGNFVTERKGCTDIRMVVEGDDCLAAYNGPRIEAKDFENLGLSCKLERHSNIETASFCGIIFDSIERKTITDPRKVLSLFGWGDGKYARCKESKKRRLLRCKALSLAYQYPGCPIIWALAEYGMRMTGSYNIGSILTKDSALGWWKRTQLQEAVDHQHEIVLQEPGPNSRLLVEELYGVTIETQLHIEKILLCKTDFGPIVDGVFLSVLHKDWLDFYDEYVRLAEITELTKPTITKIRDGHLFENLLPQDNAQRLRDVLRKRGKKRVPISVVSTDFEGHRIEEEGSFYSAAHLGVSCGNSIE